MSTKTAITVKQAPIAHFYLTISDETTVYPVMAVYEV